jgi:hypothetical protein
MRYGCVYGYVVACFKLSSTCYNVHTLHVNVNLQVQKRSIMQYLYYSDYTHALAQIIFFPFSDDCDEADTFLHIHIKRKGNKVQHRKR